MSFRLISALLGLCVCFVSAVHAEENSFDVKGFAELPVLADGRVKPMDSVARISLLIIRGKQSFKTEEGKKLTPTEWLLDVLAKPSVADGYKIFLITNPDVLNLFGWDHSKGKYFSYTELQPFFSKIEEQAKLAESVEAQMRNVFQREVFKLRQRLQLYHRLKFSLHGEEKVNFLDELRVYLSAVGPGMAALKESQAGRPFNNEDLDRILQFFKQYDFMARSAYLYVVPDEEISKWRNVGQGLLESMREGQIAPAVNAYATMVDAYRKGDVEGFNRAVGEYRSYLEAGFKKYLPKVHTEIFFNKFQPFYRAMVLYVLVFVLAWLSWLVWPKRLGKTAYWILVLGFVVHTGGLILRMYLQGRPPVTNLYSSAIFVGWGAAGLGILLERIYRNGIGSVTASAVGFLSLLIAHHLSGDGDTLEMLRAVLDHNIWLATHVIIITLGYAATYVAGFLAIIYILRGVFSSSLDKQTASTLSRMVYGIICFATLFSFVGTILGGIWADQSWGRFWGWDPKENGALIIVIWNAIILHARWGGYIRERGIMVSAVFGNIVTSFSWFGVNMLGVGLHSYGFMEKSAFWLGLFIASQLIIIGLGMLPLAAWRSGRARAAASVVL